MPLTDPLSPTPPLTPSCQQSQHPPNQDHRQHHRLTPKNPPHHASPPN